MTNIQQIVDAVMNGSSTAKQQVQDAIKRLRTKRLQCSPKFNQRTGFKRADEIDQKSKTVKKLAN